MKTDMSPKAVTRRIRQTSDLRRLCLALGKNNFFQLKKNFKDLNNGQPKHQNRSEPDCPGSD